MGLLALMLLHESRRSARTSASGDLILLEDQVRSLWNRELIAERRALVERAFSLLEVGPHAIQAATSAVRATEASPADTDWPQIVAYYDLLMQADLSPIVELNRAVAAAMRDGPLAGLELIDLLVARGNLCDYHLVYAAHADLCRRLRRTVSARGSYQRALVLVQQESERRFLEKRLRELG